MASDSPDRAIQREVDRRMSEAVAAVDRGNVLSAEDLTALERLFKLRDFVARRATPVKPKWEAGLLAGMALALTLLVSFHLSMSPVELEVKASRITLTLTKNHSASLLPGEMGEVLRLRSAAITGGERVDPPDAGRAGTVILQQARLAKGTAAKAEQPPVLLQDVSIPADAECRMAFGVAYDADLHGLTLELSGSEPASVLLSVPAPDPAAAANDLKHVITVEGHRVNMRIIPAVERALTIFRNAPISEIRFETEDAKGSSVLGGRVILNEKTGGSVGLDPGDQLAIHSNQPMSLRELSLNSGELTARVAVAQASQVRLGSKELMPTLWDWIYYRWPAQLYGCLCAVAALWLTLRNWWTHAD